MLRDILGAPEAEIRAMERKGVIEGPVPNADRQRRVAWSTSISHTGIRQDCSGWKPWDCHSHREPRVVDRQTLGRMSCPVRARMCRRTALKVALGVRRFAPELGQDNLHVLRDILGAPEAEIRAMERKGGGQRGGGGRGRRSSRGRPPTHPDRRRRVAWSTSISHTGIRQDGSRGWKPWDCHSQGRGPDLSSNCHRTSPVPTNWERSR